MPYSFGREGGGGIGSLLNVGAQLARQYGPQGGGIRQASYDLPGIDIAPQGTVAAGGGVCGPRATNPHTRIVPNACGTGYDTYVKAPKAIYKVSVRQARRGCRKR